MELSNIFVQVRVKCARQYLAEPAFVCCFNTVESSYTETKQTVTATLETAFTVRITTYCRKFISHLTRVGTERHE